MSCDPSSPLCVCFNSISTVQGVSYAQLQDYALSWELFRRVELYNSNISTLRAGGASNKSYWQFPTCEDRTLYNQGASLFITYLGYSTIVQKN